MNNGKCTHCGKNLGNSYNSNEHGRFCDYDCRMGYKKSVDGVNFLKKNRKCKVCKNFYVSAPSYEYCSVCWKKVQNGQGGNVNNDKIRKCEICKRNYTSPGEYYCSKCKIDPVRSVTDSREKKYDDTGDYEDYARRSRY